jgi:hypothetical protein
MAAIGESMSLVDRVALPALLLLLCAASMAAAEGIEPGLWKITSHSEQGGRIAGPPGVSGKCLTADQAKDVQTTFSPISTTVNSECAPIDRKFDGTHLTWHLVCTGQLNMDLAGDFTFDTPRHYKGQVHSKAEMAGMTGIDGIEVMEGEWVGECPR